MTRTVVLSLAIALALAGCGDGDLVVSEAWARPSPSMSQAAAFYMEIRNPSSTADTLIAATSPTCQTVELHESKLDDAQVMSMSRLEDGIPLAADSTVALEPGGMHIMCIGLDHELAVGEVVTVQLDFEHAADREISVEVREN